MIGVQAENAPAIVSKFHDSKGITPFLPTLAEGTRVKDPGKVTMDIIQNYVDDMIMESEQKISSVILFMLESEKTLIEGTDAAVLNKKLSFTVNRIGVIVSGGNFDVAKPGECVTTSTDYVNNY